MERRDRGDDPLRRVDRGRRLDRGEETRTALDELALGTTGRDAALAQRPFLAATTRS